jgi:hypothetical protein
MNIARELALTPTAKTVLRHLRKRGTISPMEALNTYGLPKVAKQIHELRQAGYDISSDLRHDEAGHRYARYRLPKGANTVPFFFLGTMDDALFDPCTSVQVLQ